MPDATYPSPRYTVDYSSQNINQQQALQSYVDARPVAHNPATLSVERYGDALWLCAVRGAGSEPLAHFSSPEAAQRFRVLLAATQASARAAGASGI